MKSLTIAILLLASAGAACAQTVREISPGSGIYDTTRELTRSGPRVSRWTSIPDGDNTASHEARPGRTFEDAGMGIITFEVKARNDGTARVQLHDVGDTKHFAGFTLNGQEIAIPEPRKNGSVFRVLLDFGSAGWHQVVAATRTVAPTKLDGFSVGACRR